MLSLLAIGLFAQEEGVTRSVPISIPRIAARQGDFYCKYSLLSLLKLFSHPTGNSGGPKVKVGSRKGITGLMAKLQRIHVREELLVAVGGVNCHLLGAWFFPEWSGFRTRCPHGRVNQAFLVHPVQLPVAPLATVRSWCCFA